jgi:hypothetical protein
MMTPRWQQLQLMVMCPSLVETYYGGLVCKHKFPASVQSTTHIHYIFI